MEPLITVLSHKIRFAAEGPIPAVSRICSGMNNNRRSGCERRLIMWRDTGFDEINAADVSERGPQQVSVTGNAGIHGLHYFADLRTWPE